MVEMIIDGSLLAGPDKRLHREQQDHRVPNPTQPSLQTDTEICAKILPQCVTTIIVLFTSEINDDRI